MSNPFKKLKEKLTGTAQTGAQRISGLVGLDLRPDAIVEAIKRGELPESMISPSGSPNILGVPSPVEFIKELVEGLAEVIQSLVENVLGDLDAFITSATATVQGAALKIIGSFESTANRIITKTTDAFSDLLQEAANSLKEILDSIFEDVKAVMGTVNDYVKDRIDQVGVIILESLDSVREIVSEFTPGKINKDLVQPALDKIGDLQKQLFEDINKLLDKIINKGEQLIRAAKWEIDMKEIPKSRIGRQTLRELKFDLPTLKLSRLALFTFWETFHVNIRKEDKTITVEESLAISDELRNKASLMRFIDLQKDLPNNDFLARKWLEYSVNYNTQLEFAGLSSTLTPGNAPPILAKKLQDVIDRHKAKPGLGRLIPIWFPNWSSFFN